MRKNSFKVMIASLFMAFSMAFTLPMECLAATDNTFACDETIISDDENQSGLYHFRDKGTCGVTIWLHDCIQYEGYAGFRAVINGTKITLTGYDNAHNGKYEKGEVALSVDKTEIPLGELEPKETMTVNIADVIKSNKLTSDDNCYKLTETFAKNDAIVSMLLYYDGNKLQICRRFDTKANDDFGFKQWNQLVGNLNPKDYLDINIVGKKNNPITYPTSGNNGHCNHVDKWRELSHEIIINNSWSDDKKVFALVRYLCVYYAYDDWRVTKNKNASRATLAQDWSDDDLWMYYNHVGNCWDFANAFTIMCRENGIPCTSVDNDGHTANAVWLNDEWVCIDISVLNSYYCVDEDTDEDKWIPNDAHKYHFENYYGYYSNQFTTINQGLCTPLTATGIDNPQ